jgi:hypothetical protein
VSVALAAMRSTSNHHHRNTNSRTVVSNIQKSSLLSSVSKLPNKKSFSIDAIINAYQSDEERESYDQCKSPCNSEGQRSLVSAKDDVIHQSSSMSPSRRASSSPTQPQRPAPLLARQLISSAPGAGGNNNLSSRFMENVQAAAAAQVAIFGGASPFFHPLTHNQGSHIGMQQHQAAAYSASLSFIHQQQQMANNQLHHQMAANHRPVDTFFNPWLPGRHRLLPSSLAGTANLSGKNIQ